MSSRKTTTTYTFKSKDETQGAVNSVTGGLDKVNQRVTDAIGKYGVLAAGSLSLAAATYKVVDGFIDFVSGMATTGDEMDKMSSRTGLLTEKLSKYDFMVKRGGGTTADLEAFVKRLSRSMSDARDGIKESVDAWDRLGIKTWQLMNKNGGLKDIDEVLPMVADGLRSINSQTDRMDISQAIGGRGGTKLLPFLKEGREEFKALTAEIEKYGGAMTSEFSAKSAKYVDAQTNLSNAAQRLKEAVADPFLVPFTDAINHLAEVIAKAKGLVDSTNKNINRNSAGWGSVIMGERLLTSGGGVTPTSQSEWDAWQDEQERLEREANRNPLSGPTGPYTAGANGPMPQDIPVWDTVNVLPEITLEYRRINQEAEQWVSKLQLSNHEVGEISDSSKVAAYSLTSAMGSAFDAILEGARTIDDAISKMFTSTLSMIASGLFRIGLGAGLNLVAPGLGTAIGLATSGSSGTLEPISDGAADFIGPPSPASAGAGAIKSSGGAPAINVVLNIAGLMTDPLAIRQAVHMINDELEQIRQTYLAVPA